MDILKGSSMEEVLKKQNERHSKKAKQQCTAKRTPIRLIDISTIKTFFPNAKSTLCVGSRDDSEVRDFINNNFNAIGIDILDETKLIKKIDAHNLNDHFSENEFDIIFASHVLEHLLDAKKVMQNIRYIAKQGLFLVLPAGPAQNPKWNHPTVFEIMKLVRKRQTSAIFSQPDKYKNIWNDFNSLKPFQLMTGGYRDGLTEPREIYICLKF